MENTSAPTNSPISSDSTNNSPAVSANESKFPEYGEFVSHKEGEKFEPVTDEAINNMKIRELREYLSRYRNLTVAAIKGRELEQRKAELLAKQAELSSIIADRCREEMSRIQKSFHEATIDVLIHQKKQLESNLSIFDRKVNSFSFSLKQYMSDTEAVRLLVKLARRYPHDMDCADTVYIALNSEEESRKHPILDDYEYGISIKILDAVKYKCYIDFGDDFNRQHPELTIEVIGFDDLCQAIDKLIAVVPNTIAEFLKAR